MESVQFSYSGIGQSKWFGDISGMGVYFGRTVRAECGSLMWTDDVEVLRRCWEGENYGTNRTYQWNFAVDA